MFPVDYHDHPRTSIRLYQLFDVHSFVRVCEVGVLCEVGDGKQVGRRKGGVDTMVAQCSTVR